MSFNLPREYERNAKDICDLLGITKLTDTKFTHLTRRVNVIKSEGANEVNARLGRNVITVLGNLEHLTEKLASMTQ